MGRANKDTVEVWFDYNLDIPGRTIWMGSIGEDENGSEAGTDHNMAELAVKGLYILDRAAPSDDKPITILMSNPGGSVMDGMTIFDAIENCVNHVKIIGLGKVMSMGAVIMQAADERVMAPGAVFMMHMGTDAYPDLHPKIIENWVEFTKKKYNPMVNNLLYRRMVQKNPKLTPAQFDKMNMFDTILMAQDTIDLGLADRLLEDGEMRNL